MPEISLVAEDLQARQPDKSPGAGEDSQQHDPAEGEASRQQPDHRRSRGQARSRPRAVTRLGFLRDRFVDASIEMHRPDPGTLSNLRWLAGSLLFIIGFSCVPMLWTGLGVATPVWARLGLALLLVELLAVCGMLIFNDWLGAWMVMYVFALAAAVFGAAAALGQFAPAVRPLPWGLNDVRTVLARWALSLMLLHGLGAFVCGWFAARWRQRLELRARIRTRRSRQHHAG